MPARRWFIALLLHSVVLLTGCSRGHDPATDDGNVLRQDALRTRGFDPARVSDVPSALAISRIYETLLQYDYLARPYTVIPLLAESLPTISPDGLVLTFRIRRGISFQDDPCFASTGGKGRELTAEDFVYSIKRLADPRLSSPGWWAFSGRIVGLDDFRSAAAAVDATDYTMPVEGLRAIDSHTLQLTLTGPYPQLLWILAMHYASAVPREAVEFYGRDFVNHPVGTGPYILSSWVRNYRMEFVRNPVWAESGRTEPEAASVGSGVVPAIDRIVDYIVSDPSTRWLLFLRGEIDSSEISRDNWDAVTLADGTLRPELAARGIVQHRRPGLRIAYIGFNMEDPVVGPNKKLRQALSCAFNTKEWESFFNGRVKRPNGPIPEGLPGYDPAPSPYAHDLDKAKRLLAEAGYPDGVDPATGRRLQLTIDSGRADDPEARQSMELITAFFEKIGIVLSVNFSTGPTFFDRLDRKQTQMYSLSWFGDYPDAENFLQCFYGPNASAGANHSNYANPAFDRLFEEARILPDGDERSAKYRQLAAMVVEDCPWIFTSQPVVHVLVSPRLKNYVQTDFPYGMEKYYRLERRGVEP